MKRLKLFFINTLILTITALFVRSIGMVFNVYVTNKIGSEGIGIFTLLMSIYMFATTLANSGVYLASTRIVAEEMAAGSRDTAIQAIKKCIIYSLIFGTLAGILLCLVSNYLVTTFLHSQVSIFTLICMAISLPFTSIITSIEGYFTAVKKVMKTSSEQLLGLLIKISITVFLLTQAKEMNTNIACQILILANTISEIFSFCYLFLLYWFDKRKMQISFASSKENPNLLKRILRISLPVAVTSYIRSGLSSLKQMLIPLRLEKSGLSCQESLSKYGIINGMVMPILMFPSIIINSFANLLVPEFARYHTKQDYRRMNEVINIIFRATLTFSIGMVGVLLIFSPSLSILVYNGTNVANFIKILCPLISIMYLDSMVDAILKGLDEQVNVMFCNILDLFVSIGIIFFLVPIYGIYGYLAVIFVSEILNFTISMWQLYHKTHFKFEYIANIFIPVISTILTMFLIQYFNPYTLNTFILIFNIGIFIGIYLLICFACNILHRLCKKLHQ